LGCGVVSFHPWWRWECYENGFYEPASSCPKKRLIDETSYMNFHIEENTFIETLEKVSNEWLFSFENFMSNKEINRVAWVGQASVCFKLKISSCNRGAYNRLDLSIRRRQNKIAEEFIKRWEDEYNSGVSGKVYKKLDEERIRDRDSRRSPTSANERKHSPIIQGDMFGYFK
jgi:hypothetical protein